MDSFLQSTVPGYLLAIDPYKPGKPLEELEREYGIADSVKLASNENPWGPSPLALRAIGERLAGLHRYPDGGGHLLTGKIASVLGVEKGNIVLGNGSDDIIGLLAQAFLHPGTEAVLPFPSFLMYRICAVANGAVPVSVPLRRLTVDLEAMAAAVTPRTRMVFLCNPNNPTGTVVRRADFERFVDALPEEVLVVVDEAYHEFVRAPDRFSGVEYLRADRPLVVLRTFSKAYGLAGLRIGFGVMPEAVAAVLHRIRMPFNASVPAQAGAEAALDDTAHLEKTVAGVHRGLDELHAGLERLGVSYYPTEANFFLVDVARDAGAVFEAMLRQGVIVRSMVSYGFPHCIRVNVGLPGENARFLAALETVLAGGREEDGDGLLITIDGPAGAGKTTVSRRLAERLGYRYVDTGALYRSVALMSARAGVAETDDAGLERVCRNLDLRFAEVGGKQRVLADGVDISDEIRSPEITMRASAVSARPAVRRFLLDVQRSLGKRKRAVFEGRDMGTVVFPAADLKFFLDASGATRARRRYEQYAGAGGQSLEKVAAELRRRDRNDSERSVAPLKPAGDARIVDSTDLSVAEVVEEMLGHVRRLLEKKAAS